MSKTSLEQWEALRAVVEEGSFAKAAEKLNKSQSGVSYMLTKLQQRVPVQIFVPGNRKAVLTDDGEALYRHALNLIAQAEQLDKTAEYLAAGWEPEVSIAVDALTDLTYVFKGLQKFSNEYPQPRIRLLETTLSGTEEAILTRQADIAITPKAPPGFLGQPYAQVCMIPVASPSHPLAKLSEISEAQLKLHRQIVIRDSGIKREQDGGWLGSEQRWTVSHFATSIKAIKAGLGFAFVPDAFVQKPLAAGELSILSLSQGGQRTLSLSVVMTRQSHTGAAAQKVCEFLLANKPTAV